MATNIEITAQMNKMLADQNQLLLVQAKIQRGQLAIMQQMAEAMGNVDVSKLNENFKQINDQIEAADAALKKMEQTGQTATGNVASGGKKMKSALEAASDAAGATAKNIEKINVAAMAIDGAIAGFQATFNILGGVKNILKNVISTFGQFALSVIRFPFALWSFLFEKAAGDGGGGGGLREALEAIRKEFGDLRTNGAKAIQDLAKSMSGTLGATGLSVYKTFGNLAERLKYFTEVAKNLGNMFGVIVSGGLIKSAEAVGAFQKGLNISAEGMKAVARQSILSGRTMDEELRETANYAIQMGEAFGINAQVIGHDMAELEADMKHFGGMSKKALSETVVYAHKLGIEVKSLAGIMDTFDNFDTAAEAAARLNQQFGIQVDVQRLMRAENPAERLDMLRQGLERTGKSFDQLTRREQTYLAQQVNLSPEEAILAFRKGGASLDEIQKKSAEAEKKQISQAEAMQKLAGSIERLIKSGGALQKGLFAAFFEGFERGIFRSRDFLKVFREIRQVLRTVRRAGIQVGRAFVETFPGVQNIVKGLQDLFNPARWKKTMDSVVNVFKDFFKELQTNPEAGMKNLFERLKNIFFNHFDASTGAGRRIIEGFKTFFKTILAAGVAGLKIAIPLLFDGLTKIIRGINGFLKGEQMPIDVNGFAGQIIEILSGLWKTIKDAAPPLIEALKELFSTAFTKLSEMIEPYKGRIMLLLFGPALFRGALGALSAGLTNVFIQSMVKAATTASASTAAQGAVGGIARRMPPMPPPGRQLSSIPLSPRAAGQIVQTNDALGRFGVTDATKLGLKLVAIAVALAVGGVAIAGSMWAISKITNTLEIEDILKSMLVLTTGVVAMVGLSVAAKALSAADAAKAMAAMPAVEALGVLGLLMAVGMGLIIGAFKLVGFTEQDAKTATVAMAGAATIFLAAAGLAYAGAGLAAIAATGIGGGAIAAGVGLIAVVVGGMIAGTLEIIDSIKNINIGGDVEGFKVRLDAFTKVFQAIVSFAGVFSAVMAAGAVSSVASLVQLLNPVGAIAALFGIGPAAGPSNPIQMLTELVHSISGGIVDIIAELGTISLNPEQLKNLEVIGPIVSAIAGLAEALRPPSGGSQEIGLTGITTEYAINLKEWFSEMKGILLGDGGLIQSASAVIQELSTIPNVNIEAVKASASILSGIVGLVGSIKIDPEYVKALTEATGRGGISRISAKAEDALRGQVQGVISIINAVKDNIPALISGIVEVTKGLSIGQLNRAAKGAEVVGSIIGTVVSLINSVKETGAETLEGGGTAFNAGTFRSIFGQAKEMVTTLFSGGNGGVIKTIVDAISNSGISGLPRGIDTKVKAVSDILTAIVSISSMGQDGIGNISAGITAINTQLLSIVGENGPFAQMIASINAVGAVLNTANPVNINTEMNKFVKKAGLATGEYTINNRNFTLQVNVKVNLDADRFEQALQTRPGGSSFVVAGPGSQAGAVSR